MENMHDNSRTQYKTDQIILLPQTEHNLIINRILENTTEKYRNYNIYALIMLGSSQGLDNEAQYWREAIYYIVAMDPWSKVGLLTEHLGGNHGDGGASRDQFALRQGAGIGTSTAPDLVIAATVEQ